jgi:hypothetical protein
MNLIKLNNKSAMNNTKLTETKFQACMRHSLTKFGVFDLYTNKELYEYNFQEFNKIMIEFQSRFSMIPPDVKK